jgi:uncharacterized protein
MKFSLADTSESNSIQRYDEAGITLSIAQTPNNPSIETQHFEHSLFVCDNYILPAFPASILSDLTAKVLMPLFELNDQLNLDILLIGSQNQSGILSTDVMALFIEQRMGVECMSLGAACRTYNMLLNESRRVSALLLL